MVQRSEKKLWPPVLLCLSGASSPLFAMAGYGITAGRSAEPSGTSDRKVWAATGIALLPVANAAVAGGSKPLVEQDSNKRTDNTDGVIS